MSTIEYKSPTNVTVDGEKVRFAHFRCFSSRNDQTVEPRGGATIAYIGDKKVVRYAGLAVCSVKDNFNYHYGRQKAVGRLLQGIKAGLPGDPLGDEVLDDFHYPLPKFLKDETRDNIENFLEMLGYARW